MIQLWKEHIQFLRMQVVTNGISLSYDLGLILLPLICIRLVPFIFDVQPFLANSCFLPTPKLLRFTELGVSFISHLSYTTLPQRYTIVRSREVKGDNCERNPGVCCRIRQTRLRKRANNLPLLKNGYL